MTNVQTARDVIDQVKAFHRKLGDLYQGLSDTVEKERVKILLEYMSRHHDNLAYIMDEYEEGLTEKVLNTWFMYVHEECDLSPFFDANLGPDTTAQEAILVALDLDKCLMETYEAMLAQEVPDEVSEVFERLLEFEKKEKIKLAKTSLMIEDM
ncbi:hypothetical protein GM415_10040 [Pseudodesulfovibrio cashew]|uniref:Uncharacterized protein n=1 Tax=Pseudodesulfovibrio cashew TaxID=2678688 RepID=A0A6I6JE82_9BACT|nr:hypothetical protein [Pseudodesulfovibrio cashew]QGY40451.1 hypothetical protein GM415_10040 [Pseudodesulfovibrio cashew]